MDATTLYVIVTLANGDVRTADFVSLGSAERCQEARRNGAGLLMPRPRIVFTIVSQSTVSYSGPSVFGPILRFASFHQTAAPRAAGRW